MKAWTHQDSKQVRKRGPDKASWYASWIDPEGKRRCLSCGPGIAGKRKADKKVKQVEAELLTGTYQAKAKVLWEDFREEYEERMLPGLSARTREEVKSAMNHFQRVLTPKRIQALTTAHIDRFIARRRTERGKKSGDTVSPATINKELRHMRAVLHVANEWGYLSGVPKFRTVKAPVKLPRYVIGDHFAGIYKACDEAKYPEKLPYPAADWWRALLVTAYMTGWRIGEILALTREDLDMKAGAAITRAKDNKGKRDEIAKLHPVVLEHLERVASFHPKVFPWPYNKTTLYVQFAKIQEAAGIKLVCASNHTHTRYCHLYGFHDFRRAFATMNAEKLTPDALQALMRHKSYSTTQRYIAIAHQLNSAVGSLHVPDVLRKVAEA